MVSVLMQIAPQTGKAISSGPGRSGSHQGGSIEMVDPKSQEGGRDEPKEKSKQRAKSKQG